MLSAIHLYRIQLHYIHKYNLMVSVHFHFCKNAVQKSTLKDQFTGKFSILSKKLLRR